MASEFWANDSRSTLAAGITSGATTLTIVAPGTGRDFPASVPFRAICGTEILLVTARASNVFTVTRGYEGTTAAAHASGAVISHGLTAGALTDLAALTAGAGYWAPLTNGDPTAPELVYDDEGQAVMVWLTL